MFVRDSGFVPRCEALQLAPDWDGVRSVAESVLMSCDVSERADRVLLCGHVKLSI